ncbi:MAG: tetratricopeptide repeat protein [Phycisphaerales bacterium]|nr:MAG: tetratricopeptide repeat protein [Phycisphaerales bacterium]
MGLGEQDEAIEELNKDIQISPESSFSYFLLGQLYLQRREYEKARENYEKAIAIQPDYTNAYYGLLTVCTRLKLKAKASAYMATFRKLKTEDMKILKDRNDVLEDLAQMRKGAAQTYLDAARVYQAGGNLQKAEGLLGRAVALDPNNTACLEWLASLYAMNNQASEAIELYEKISEIEPENPLCYLNIGHLSARLKRTAKAEESFRTVIQLAPELSAGYRELAQLYLQTARALPEARELAEKAVTLEAVAINYFVLSWACDRNGDSANALKAMQRAVQLEPSNPKYKKIYEHIKNRN